MSVLILVSHGDMAKEMLKSAEMIMGPTEQTHTVGLYPNQGPDDLQNSIKSIIESYSEENYIFMTDLIGGTPNNVVLKECMKKENTEVLSGLNLGMVISYLNQMIISGSAVNEEIIRDGKKSLVDVKKLLIDKTEEEMEN